MTALHTAPREGENIPFATPWLVVRGMGAAQLALPAPDAQNALAPLNTAVLTEQLRRYYATATPPLQAPALRRIPQLARVGLHAALTAMEEAAWALCPEGATRTAVVVGTAHSGVEMSMDLVDSLLDQGPRLSSPTAFSHSVNNMPTGLLSLVLNLRGPCQSVSQFELSFAGALQAAALLLASGRATRALVGALDESDPRFARCSAHEENRDRFLAQGGIFFCLELSCPEQPAPKHSGPELRVCWPPEPEAPGEPVAACSLSHAFALWHALQPATRQQAAGKRPTRLVCSDRIHKRTARVEVRNKA